ncbi:hypothetical protein QVD17_20077 [Tagetes erecta]|uniref:Dof zinc finger protein n=1 Tax=Tagetes erecta TaxID=13708 RepID=A0AAD8KKL7_TARER|nr:hypothetical protein QVD17_20077 [Tagetes erecta]
MTDENEAGKQPRQPLNYPREPPPFPPPNCPRCYSSNTKFCYYNNYSVSQPRYLCKQCRRYWTHGGVLRSIPSGGTSRKRGRADCESSSSQMNKPLTTSWSMTPHHNPVGADACSSDGYGTIRPEVTQTTPSFNNSGGFYYQPPFMFNQNHELSGVNTAFGAVNVAFGVSATPTPQPAPSTRTLPQLPPLNGFGEYGIPFAQSTLHRPPQPQPQPPTAWVSQNMGVTSTNSDNFLATNNEATADANVVNINEWSELNDMENEGDPLQTYREYRPPSP